MYDSIEAQNSFCQLAGQEGLTHNVLRRIRDFSHCLHAGDRVIIVFVGHGQKGSGNIILSSQRGLEYLTKAEVLASLYSLPPNVRVLLVSEACYSGSWTTITSDAGARRHGERSYNCDSGSGAIRCPLLRAAFIQEFVIP